MKKFSYLSIAESIYKDFIIAKQLNPGDTIPTEQFLTEYYKVSRTTIRKSIQSLITKNIVTSIQGSGTFVKTERKELKISRLDNFNEYAQYVNGDPFTKVTAFEIIPAQENIAKLLHIETGDLVYYTKRIRFLNQDPVLVETGYMPVVLFPDLTFEIMSNSKYDYIEKQKNLVIKNSYIHFDPIILDIETAKILDTNPKLPAICIKSQSFLEDGTLFEYTEAIRNPQKYDIIIEVLRNNQQNLI